MFHVMLVLPVLIVAIILLAIIACVILFGILAIISAIAGGTATALLIKNETVKKLLIIGFCILFSIGVLCVSPFIIAYFNLPLLVFGILSLLILIVISIFSSFGIKISKTIANKNKIGKSVLLVVFSTILITVISLIIFIALALFRLV